MIFRRVKICNLTFVDLCNVAFMIMTGLLKGGSRGGCK